MKKLHGSAVMAVGILSVISLFALGAKPSSAYCVYNNTSEYISEVHGEFCSRCLSTSIAPGSKACCPGGESGCRGKTLITVSVPNTGWQTGMHYGHCGEKVTAHGWVKITGGGQFFRCDVYDDKGGLIWGGILHEGKN